MVPSLDFHKVETKCECFVRDRLTSIFNAFFPRAEDKEWRWYQVDCALKFIMSVLTGCKQKSFLAHIGCGGGKTEIYMAVVFFLLAYTQTTHVIVVS